MFDFFAAMRILKAADSVNFLLGIRKLSNLL